MASGMPTQISPTTGGQTLNSRMNATPDTPTRRSRWFLPVLCALAPDPTTLIAARLLQGFGGAAMWPQVLSIIQVEYEPAERPKAFGVQGLVQGVAAIAGQIVG